jgi:hypothetical protein
MDWRPETGARLIDDSVRHPKKNKNEHQRVVAIETGKLAWWERDEGQTEEIVGNGIRNCKRRGLYYYEFHSHQLITSSALQGSSGGLSNCIQLWAHGTSH